MEYVQFHHTTLFGKLMDSYGNEEAEKSNMLVLIP